MGWKTMFLLINNHLGFGCFLSLKSSSYVAFLYSSNLTMQIHNVEFEHIFRNLACFVQISYGAWNPNIINIYWYLPAHRSDVLRAVFIVDFQCFQERVWCACSWSIYGVSRKGLLTKTTGIIIGLFVLSTFNHEQFEWETQALSISHIPWPFSSWKTE